MTIKILFIDDEQNVLEGLKDSLYKYRDEWEMYFLSNSLDAAKMIAANDINIVVTDMLMPLQNGIDILKDVICNFPGVRVVLMTGKPSMEAAIDCIKLGASNYISKPVDRDRLVSILTELTSECINGDTLITKKKRMIGGYEIVRTIAEGGMGIVFYAEKQQGLVTNSYAVKILKSISCDVKKNKEDLERFVREAEVASKLNHPNIVKIVEYGLAEEEQIPFIAMDYIDGPSLHAVIYENNLELSLVQKATIIIQIATALKEIHSVNILHRDIKPGNILLDAHNTAMLTDFGIVKVEDSTLTRNTTFLGTPAYIAPEYIMNPHKADVRSDIFSLGCVAFHLFLNTLPFAGNSIANMLRKIVNDDPLKPCEIDPEFPKSLEIILLKMIAKLPKDRYQTSQDLIKDIECFLLNSKVTI